MFTVGDELTLRDEPLRVKKVTDKVVVLDRLNPPPPARSWVPEPKVYVITTSRVDELLAEGALVPTAVTRGNRMNPFTDEQYKSEHQRIMNDERYPPDLKAWAIEQIQQMYRERNEGKEPPIVTAVTQ